MLKAHDELENLFSMPRVYEHYEEIHKNEIHMCVAHITIDAVKIKNFLGDTAYTALQPLSHVFIFFSFINVHCH